MRSPPLPFSQCVNEALPEVAESPMTPCAFHVAKARAEEEEQEVIKVVPEAKGVHPVRPPGVSGRLEYRITIGGIPTIALMDHGASPLICW